MDKKKQTFWKYGFAIIIILIGLILNYKNIGTGFLNFDSIGNWLIYVGFVMLTIVTLQFISDKKRIVDERMQLIGMKASRITYVAIILVAFITMVIDGIKTITIPYSRFMSTFVCGIVLIYFISYKILEKRN
jgi:uncharacterized membrane protein